MAIDEGDESSRLNILLNQLLVEIWAGELAVAEEVMVTLRETAVQLGLPNGADVWQTYLDAHLGKLGRVRESATAAERQEPIVDMLYLRSLGVAELAAGDNKAADRDLESAGSRLEEIGFREPAVWRVEADRIEAAVEVGDTARADRLTTRLERQAERSRIPWNLVAAARSRGILAAASGDTEGATSHSRAHWWRTSVVRSRTNARAPCSSLDGCTGVQSESGLLMKRSRQRSASSRTCAPSSGPSGHAPSCSAWGRDEPRRA